MLSRYSDQARSRKGFVLTGVILLVFGALMALWGSIIGAFVGFSLGSILFVPPLLFGYKRYQKFERFISWFATFGGLA